MGAFEEAKGKVKEKVGDAVGNDRLQAEGQAQDTKGSAETEESKHRAAAQSHEKKAEELEREARNV